jgi:diguanylate cyclase (GGDEF)-like protein
LYRIGGEEFAILSIQTDREDEIKFANRLREEVKSKNFENIGTITISIGITQQQDGDSYKTLFERADKALYNAKKSGRDNVQVI